MQYAISFLPIVLLFVLMLKFRLSGYLSALVTLAITILLGLFVAPRLEIIPQAYELSPIYGLIGWSVVEGVLKAIFPIFLIILMAIFSYNILVQSKQIECIKAQFISLTDDRGILVLLMVWGFGGLLEGMAGFGTAVAIPAAILIGLGFKPFFSAVVALLGNTVATGFAAVGVPVTTLCNEAVAGGNASLSMIKEVSGFTVMQLSPLFFFIPFVILM
ncbi:MAG: L-lactate permease, partial [Muribaculaceae bacterium]|nr:L-lactate permease [Muribaculaceae bacterium]